MNEVRSAAQQIQPFHHLMDRKGRCKSGTRLNIDLHSDAVIDTVVPPHWWSALATDTLDTICSNISYAFRFPHVCSHGR